MKMLTGTYFSKRSFLRRSLTVIITVVICFFTSCTKKPRPYSILEFEGKGGVYNYSKSILMFGYDADSLYKTAHLANPGDLIMYGESNFFTWNGTTPTRFSFKDGDSASFLNDKISTIYVPEEDKMIPWFKEILSKDLSKLEFISFGSKISEGAYPVLIDLAKTKPDIGLCFMGEFKDMSRPLKIFNPRIIIGGNLSSNDYNILAGLDNLEILSATLKDSLTTGQLPALPKLRQINLMGYEYYPEISDDFLINNSQVENLIIMSTGKFDFSVLKPLSNLKELVINSCDTVFNPDLLKSHKQIEVLVLNWQDFTYNITKDDLPAIRWINFISGATQIEFDSFIASHPGIEVVEISNNKSIRNFESLLKLRKLYGLTVTDTLMDFNTLKSLIDLKYLSLPQEVLGDSLRNNELKKALPNTRLVATTGVCLGSGWLVLIIPMILLFIWYFKMKPGRTEEKI
jgi:hypothetical protein